MKKLRGALALVLVVSVAGWAGCGDTGGGPGDEGDPVLADLDAMMDGVPDKADLPEEKADGIPPTRFDLVALQSPVKSQGRRGVCSIFAAVALMEHLYRAESTYPDIDFSEQYLQWSVKFEVGSFPNTSGSNTYSNLKAISQYGIVEEEYWPYETYQWDEDDDPACNGEDDQPTRCYTNGEPPQTAQEADKWKLPSGRYIRATADSIKAFMHNNGQGVVASGTFFYQAWNHGGSTLPTNYQYKRKGYVLAPNQEDRSASLEHRAGHGFLLVGWDDELEVQAMDADGNPMVDENGDPVMQQGFFLFKNSWGTSSFGVDNPHGAGYGWIAYEYVEDDLSVYGADLPDVENPVEDEICDDGIDNDQDDLTDCDDLEDCQDAENCQGGELFFENTTRVDIPDDDPDGATSTIDVPVDVSIASLTVGLNISHTYLRDLHATLVHPDGTRANVFEGISGEDLVREFTITDFAGKSTLGTWTLEVIDGARLDVGKINSWSLRIVGGEPAETLPITSCRLVEPVDLLAEPGNLVDTSGRLYIEGHTDQTSGVDAHPSLLGQVGYGTQGSEPDASWTWINASATPGWDDTSDPGRDAYQAGFSAPAVGSYDVAYRFSGDGGQTWTVCDIDGSQNGYDSAEAGKLTVETSGEEPVLFFSEYLEGSSYNKAVEITCTTGTASLGACQLRLYPNGASSATRTQDLEGQLAAGQALVICHPSASAEIQAVCDGNTSDVINFNGDDALELVCNGQTIDVFGRLGEDPGSYWQDASGSVTTQNTTLRRKCSVVSGDPDGNDSFDPSVEWEAYPIDSTDDLGQYLCR